MFRNNKIIILILILATAVCALVGLAYFSNQKPGDSVTLTPTKKDFTITLHKNPRKIEGVILLTLQNNSDKSIYYQTGCPRNSIQLQKLMDGEYKAGSLSIASKIQCNAEIEPPTRVEPGESATFQDPSQLAYFTDPSGTFRASLRTYNSASLSEESSNVIYSEPFKVSKQ